MKKLDLSSVLQIVTPDNGVPVVFDSPHSGTLYPDDFRYSCDKHTLRKIEDSYVDQLFEHAPEHGAVFLNALFPRGYIDVNRARNDIDTMLLNTPWPENIYGSIDPTSRSDSGIGLIPRLIKAGNPIYDRLLTPDEIMNRVKNYYDPYHDTLCAALNNAYYHHGHVFHINCHSMPSGSAYPKHKPCMFEQPSDIVLGNRNGQTCGRALTHMLRDFWVGLGYSVSINDPFQGVELITRYAQPTRGRHSIQVEINRSLYMDEKSGSLHKGFEKLKQDCTNMVTACVSFAKKYPREIAAD